MLPPGALRSPERRDSACLLAEKERGDVDRSPEAGEYSRGPEPDSSPAS